MRVPFGNYKHRPEGKPVCISDLASLKIRVRTHKTKNRKWRKKTLKFGFDQDLALVFSLQSTMLSLSLSLPIKREWEREGAIVSRFALVQHFTANICPV